MARINPDADHAGGEFRFPRFPDLKRDGDPAKWSPMNPALADNSSVAIWKRTIRPRTGSLSPAEGRALLRLKLSPSDLDRADELAAKAQAGSLAPQEERELDNYVAVASALEFLKSKARFSLSRTRTAA
jgi:hypothetical protein